MTGLSKSRISLHRQCPKRLWLKLYRPEYETIDESQSDLFNMGESVGDIARRLYPSGMLIDESKLSDALEQTST